DAALLERVDMGVYSKNRLMRILGSCKLKDLNRPLLRAEWHEPSMVAEDDEFLITNIGPDCIKITCDLQKVAVVRAPSTVIRKPQEAIQSSMPKYIVDAVRAKFEKTLQATQFFEMQCVADRAMIFELRRKVQGHCSLQKRAHPEGVPVCKRDFALAVDIEVAAALQTHHGLSHADITDDARYLTSFHLAPPLEPLKLEHSKLVKNVNQPPSLLIRCDTGGGKTVFAEKLIEANKTSRFVAITCRRTLANMQEERFIGFDNYQDFPGVIARDRLVVQSESLCRLDMKFYTENTILILDEISSLIKQMCSNKTHSNMHNLNLQAFGRLIQRVTRVICLDADLSNEEIEIMKSLRNDLSSSTTRSNSKRTTKS
ncbi:hypothetical protein BGZ50_000910, partial [Haplosporangium sp. Z 11]